MKRYGGEKLGASEPYLFNLNLRFMPWECES